MCPYFQGGPSGKAASYLEELVGCLLVFPGHGARGRASEGTHRSENGKAGEETDRCVENDLPSLIGGVLGTGTMRTECNPVGCSQC